MDPGSGCSVSPGGTCTQSWILRCGPAIGRIRIPGAPTGLHPGWVPGPHLGWVPHVMPGGCWAWRGRARAGLPCWPWVLGVGWGATLRGRGAWAATVYAPLGSCTRAARHACLLRVGCWPTAEVPAGLNQKGSPPAPPPTHSFLPWPPTAPPRGANILASLAVSANGGPPPGRPAGEGRRGGAGRTGRLRGGRLLFFQAMDAVLRWTRCCLLALQAEDRLRIG
jgi:hypothetical protein